MKPFKGIAVAVILLASSLQTVYAVPIFSDLVATVNNNNGDPTNGANITEANFNSTALSMDDFWTAMSGSKMKFRSELSGYGNTMGIADADGNNKVEFLSEGTQPGAWSPFTPGYSPFTFYLSTNTSPNNNYWFSAESLNSDLENHLLVFQAADNSKKFLFFWDDQDTAGNSDRDYNDFVAKVHGVEPVPAPASLLLLGLGLAGLSLSRRKKK
ncbi:DUF4114 domain-containing protein [Glaciecola sp. 33A]|jgi:hypothetical protein|uniref:DUF4114 domain-containing protein n=1 Tax=Glaciecola sp. 33A TaxID=2057807 RepID=UPI001E641F83|nr:DUF4114 domain-containing protein [Glaciecola sp. 33A]